MTYPVFLDHIRAVPLIGNEKIECATQKMRLKLVARPLFHCVLIERSKKDPEK